MPPRNKPLPNAVKNFVCDLCEKGYARQLEYENHLGSYDHTHRMRMAETRKDIAAKEVENSKSKGLPFKRVLDGPSQKVSAGAGPRFKKIGGATPSAGGGPRFKKIGGTGFVSGKSGQEKVKDEDVKTEGTAEKGKNIPGLKPETPTSSLTSGKIKAHQETKKADDVKMTDEEQDEIIDWEEYDFTKPTGCDHARCSGCKADGIFDYDSNWDKDSVKSNKPGKGEQLSTDRAVESSGEEMDLSA